MAERTTRRGVQATPLRGYQDRRRELTEAFNLPSDVREWVTVRLDPQNPEETQQHTLNVCAQAGRTSTIVDFDLNDFPDLRKAVEKALDDNRDELHHRLKLDLATNLMAQSAIRGDE